MKVTAYLTDGSELTIHNFDAESILGLGEELREATSGFLTFEMDDATVLVNRDQIVRLDIDDSEGEPSPLEAVLADLSDLVEKYHNHSANPDVQRGIDFMLGRLDVLILKHSKEATA